MLARFFKPFSIFLTVILLLGGVHHSFGALAIQNGSVKSVKTTIPIGATQVPVLYFKLEATSSVEIFKRISLSAANDVQFGQGISRVRLFRDVDGDGNFDSDETQIAEESTFASNDSVTLIISNDEQISTGNPQAKGYFIAYDITNDNAFISEESILEITSIQNENLTEATFPGSSNPRTTITISGISTYTVTDISPDVVIPGQQKVGMASIRVQVDEEHLQENIKLSIFNAFSNFTGTSTGIQRIHVYANLDDNVNTTFNKDEDVLIDTITSSAFTTSETQTSSNVVFENLNTKGLTFAASSPKTIFIVYDIGSDFKIDFDTQISAQINLFSGTGSESGLTIQKTSTLPAEANDTAVAGLTFGTLSQINTGSSLFGNGTLAPILKIPVIANHTPITLNHIVIQNTGTIPFRTNVNDDNESINEAFIYEDADGNSTYNGIETETLVSSLVLGSNGITHVNGVYSGGPGNTADTALLRFTTPIQMAANETKTFYVFYKFGANVTSEGGNNSNLNAVAKLYNVAGTSNINEGFGVVSSFPINLSGTLPASPPSADAKISVSNVNIFLESMEDISPTSVIDGQQKVPVLKFKVNVKNALTGTQRLPAMITIRNSSDTFLANNKGVESVYIYRDLATGDVGNFDINDEPFTAFTKINTSVAAISNVELTSQVNTLFLVYDIGQIASKQQATVGVTPNARTQLRTIQTDEEIQIDGLDTNIVFGGEIPNPVIPAKIEFTGHKLSFDSVAINGDQITLTISNISSSNVTITDIAPDFYKTSKNGDKLFSQINTSLSGTTLPFVLNAGSAPKEFVFIYDDSQAQFNGTVIVDGSVTYTVTIDGTSREALMTRYNSENGFVLATKSAGQINVDGTAKQPGDFSAFLKNIYRIDESDRKIKVRNNDSVPKNSKIFFEVDKANPKNSFSLTQDGLRLTFNENTSDTSEGNYSVITTDSAFIFSANNIGSNDTNLVLTVSGNDSSDPESLSLIVSDSPRIINPLFYPNPFHIGQENLVLGFNLTKESDVTVYIYNYLGQMILKETKPKSETIIGWNTIDIDAFDSRLVSGMFICKIIAKSDSGTATAKTKLAIY